MCWRPSNHPCWWRLAGGGRGAEQGPGNRWWIPPDVEAKAQHHETVSAAFIWQQQHTCGAVGGSLMERRVGGQPHMTPHFNSRHRYTPPKWPSQEEPGSGLTASAPVSDISAATCTNGVWPLLRPVSVPQNKPSTMSFSNVQSIDPSPDYTGWRFWTMRQSIGCSTLALRSSVAK